MPHGLMLLVLAAVLGAIGGLVWHVGRQARTAATPAAAAGRPRAQVSRVDRAKRLALLAHLQATAAEAPAMPVVPAAQFFDGNDDDASIAANVIEHPGVRRFAEVVSAIEARPDVQAVLVGISDPMADDEGSWPYSDTLYVLTSALAAIVQEWFTELEPDEVVDVEFGGGNDALAGAPRLLPGVRPVRVWWD